MGSIGANKTVATVETNREKFINDMVRDATKAIPANYEYDATDLLSNGDIQAVVEAYTLQYGGNDDEILNEIRDRVDKLLKTQETSTKSMVDNERGWKYPEITENIDRLEKAFNSSRSVNKVQAIARSLRSQDERITAEIERLHNGTADVPGSEKTLMSQRRRVRQLMRKVKI